MDEFILNLNGAPYSGWTDMSLSRSMERMSGSFGLGLTGKPGDQYISNQVLPLSDAEILINDTIVLTGYVDRLETSFDERNASIYVSGRDRVSDLIDCAATVDGPFEYAGQKLDQIISKIVEPYGIEVDFQADVGAAFKRMAIQPGETAFDFIERLCRYRALLPISDGLGRLLIVKPGQEKSNGKLVYGQNILSGRITTDYSNRFSLVVVTGQQEGTTDNSASDVAAVEGRATDIFVNRYRPTVLTGEQPDTSLSLTDRAKWEISISRARSVAATYKVQGWTTDGQADLWKINTIVRVDDPVRGLSRDMLIKGLTFERSRSGTLTTLDLVLPDAFDLPADSEPDDDVLGGF